MPHTLAAVLINWEPWKTAYSCHISTCPDAHLAIEILLHCSVKWLAVQIRAPSQAWNIVIMEVSCEYFWVFLLFICCAETLMISKFVYSFNIAGQTTCSMSVENFFVVSYAAVICFWKVQIFVVWSEEGQVPCWYANFSICRSWANLFNWWNLSDLDIFDSSSSFSVRLFLGRNWSVTTVVFVAQIPPFVT